MVAVPEVKEPVAKKSTKKTSIASKKTTTIKEQAEKKIAARNKKKTEVKVATEEVEVAVEVAVVAPKEKEPEYEDVSKSEDSNPETVLLKDTMTVRETLYPTVVVSLFQGDDSLTADTAEMMLGCTYPTAEQGRFDKYHYKDFKGRTVYCTNLDLQRPFYPKTCEELTKDILAGYWEFNLESIIVGKTGLILDGKHRLISLINAVQKYEADPESYPNWETPPNIQVLVALGAEENRHVVNTIGIGRRRSMADSLFASGLVPENLPAKNAKVYCKALEFGVRLLWLRIGAVDDAYSPRVRHAEAMDFIDRHPTIHHCVKIIVEENDNNERSIEKLLPLGAASGLMYLMSTSTVDSIYLESTLPEENSLVFGNIELAEKFWMSVAAKEDEMTNIGKTIAKMVAAGSTSPAERIAVLIKAWNLYVEDKELTVKNLTPNVKVDGEGVRHLVDMPCIVDSLDSAKQS